jgi:hypothetical protein
MNGNITTDSYRGGKDDAIIIEVVSMGFAPDASWPVHLGRALWSCH